MFTNSHYFYAQQRKADYIQAAENDRLAQSIRKSKSGWSAGLVIRLGDLLIALGSRLKGQPRHPDLQPTLRLAR